MRCEDVVDIREAALNLVNKDRSALVAMNISIKRNLKNAPLLVSFCEATNSKYPVVKDLARPRAQVAIFC